MKTLNLVPLRQPLEVSSQRTTPISLSSPATSVMRDFNVSAPLLIEGSTSVKEAAMIMQRAHVHFKLVIDEDDKLLGTLKYSQVSLQTQMIKKGEGYDLETLSVSDVMTPIETIEALDYAELERSSVGVLLNTLSFDGLDYCLVLDTRTNTIRGLVSAEEVARKLNAPISLRRKPNFVELFKELHTH